MGCCVTLNLIDFVNKVELNGEAGFASTKKLNTQYLCLSGTHTRNYLKCALVCI